MMKLFNFKYKNKKISIKIRECKTILSKTLGLMFRKKSLPLLFIFKKPVKQPIHSFFCNPFIAVWFSKNKIIEIKTIKSWTFSIKPKKKFNKLLEIPLDNNVSKIFIDGNRNI